MSGLPAVQSTYVGQSAGSVCAPRPESGALRQLAFLPANRGKCQSLVQTPDRPSLSSLHDIIIAGERCHKETNGRRKWLRGKKSQSERRSEPAFSPLWSRRRGGNYSKILGGDLMLWVATHLKLMPHTEGGSAALPHQSISDSKPIYTGPPKQLKKKKTKVFPPRR